MCRFETLKLGADRKSTRCAHWLTMHIHQNPIVQARFGEKLPPWGIERVGHPNPMVNRRRPESVIAFRKVAFELCALPKQVWAGGFRFGVCFGLQEAQKPNCDPQTKTGSQPWVV